MQYIMGMKELYFLLKNFNPIGSSVFHNIALAQPEKCILNKKFMFGFAQKINMLAY